MIADQEGESTNVDWEHYEEQAQQAITAATTAAELEAARVRHLGRKSVLAQALRGVRDRETGMLLNGVRQRLEAAVEERAAAIEQADLERLDAQSTFYVTLPGTRFPLGRLPVLTQIKLQIEHIFLCRVHDCYAGD